MIKNNKKKHTQTPTNKQTHTHTHTHTPTDTHTHTHTHVHTQLQTHRHTRAHIATDTETNTHTHTHTYTHTHSFSDFYLTLTARLSYWADYYFFSTQIEKKKPLIRGRCRQSSFWQEKTQREATADFFKVKKTWAEFFPLDLNRRTNFRRDLTRSFKFSLVFKTKSCQKAIFCISIAFLLGWQQFFIILRRKNNLKLRIFFQKDLWLVICVVGRIFA